MSNRSNPVLNEIPKFKDEDFNSIYDTKEDEPLKVIDNPYLRKASSEANIATAKSKIPKFFPITRYLSGKVCSLKNKMK